MRILFIAHRIPYPPNKGDKIRSFNEIKYLSKKHEIHLACLVDEKKDLQYVQALTEYCSSVDAVLINKKCAKIKALFALFPIIPLSVSCFFSKKLKKIIERKLTTVDFDIIFCFSSAMAQYVMGVKDIPRVMDFVDVDSEKWKQYSVHKSFPMSWIYRMEGSSLSRYETKIAEDFSHSVIVSKKELGLFRKLIPGVKDVSAITNGIDTEYFNPSYNENSDFGHSDSEDGVIGNQPIIVFTGVMDYFANVEGVKWFVKEVLPAVKREIPDVKFYIVGTNPTQEIKDLGVEDNVIVTGFVEDVRAYLAMATVSVAPLRIARGIQNKVLEAMAMGVPVVGTTEALEGIDTGDDCDLPGENSTEKFAENVVRIIRRTDLRETMSRKMMSMVKDKFNWNVNMKQLENALLEVAKR
ncbi:MAG: TIGR03087 family PEP-CTERM/XrtA system glycosyltransferase [Candidatus Brocadiaceae bacterium]|nr:TIGR03087 family PEP-CTERM/XrtA system glycosyltransferase [Candidatus Brocadiaceae bacterium]